MLAKPGAVSSGWISIHRDVRYHPVVGFGQPVPPADSRRGSYSRNEAWTDLLMEAAHCDVEVMNKGKVVMLHRGQLMAALSYFASRWNWTEKTVRGFFGRLETHGMAASDTGTSEGRSKGRFVRVLTICNYDVYQTAKELEGMLSGQSVGTSRAGCGQVAGKNLIIKQLNKEDSPLSPPRGGAQSDFGFAEQPPPPAPAKRKGRQPTEAKRLAEDWVLPDEWRAEVVRLHNPNPAEIDRVAVRFKRYWLSRDAKNPAKSDWKGTWLNWFDREVLRGYVRAGVGPGVSGSDGFRHAAATYGAGIPVPADIRWLEENRIRAERGEPLMPKPAGFANAA